MPDQVYSFEWLHLGTISYYLIYRQGEKQLDIYLEVSGVHKFNYIGWEASFQEWTEPPKQAISAAEQSVIRERVEAWCKSEKLKIDFGPPLDMAVEIARYKEEGWTVETLPDGTVRLSTEPEEGLLERMGRWFRK